MALSGPIWDIVHPYLEGAKHSGPNNAVALCPFHDDHSASFAINIRNGAWLCYAGCGSGGLFHLLTALGKTRQQAGRIIEPIREQIETERRRAARRTATRFRRDRFRGTHVIPEEVLGPYEYCPLHLTERGFDPKLLRAYEIGYDQRLGRVTFPIRDLYGNLVGVSGRSDQDESPRYKFYKRGRYARGEWVPGDFGANFDADFKSYDIDKSSFLWNAHRAFPAVDAAPRDALIVIVEGYKACLWLIQCGFPLTVALMGSRMSLIQADLIRRFANPIVFFLDNDEAGRAGTKKAARQIAESNINTRVVKYPEWARSDAQPDDYNCRALHRIIPDAKRWTWVMTDF